MDFISIDRILSMIDRDGVRPKHRKYKNQSLLESSPRDEKGIQGPTDTDPFTGDLIKENLARDPVMADGRASAHDPAMTDGRAPRDPVMADGRALAHDPAMTDGRGGKEGTT